MQTFSMGNSSFFSRRRGWMMGASMAVLLVALSGCSFSIDFEDGVVTTSQEVEGEGDVVSQEVELSAAFDSIDIAHTFDAVIEVGPESSVVVQAHENFFPHIETEVSSGRLTVDVAEGFSLDGVTNVTITVPVLRDLRASGVSTAAVLGTTSGERLDLHASGISELSLETVGVGLATVDLSGSSSVTIDNLTALELAGELSGQSELRVDGRARIVTLSMSGMSEAHAGELVIEQASLNASGMSEIDVRGATSVTGDLSGTTEVRVNKEAQVRLDTSGLSEIDVN